MQTTHFGQRVKVGVFIVGDVQQNWVLAIGGAADCTFTQFELGAFPQVFHRFTLMDKEVQLLTVLVDQVDLAHLQAQVIRQLGEPLLKDLFDLGASGKGGGELVEQGQIFILAGQYAITRRVITEKARINDGGASVSRQDLGDALVFFRKIRGIHFVGDQDDADQAFALEDRHSQEGGHAGVKGGKAVVARVFAEVGNADGFFRRHHCLEQS